MSFSPCLTTDSVTLYSVHLKNVPGVDPLVQQVLQVGDLVPQRSLFVQLLVNLCKVVCNISCPNLPINATTAAFYFPPELFDFLENVDTTSGISDTRVGVSRPRPV